MDATVDCRRSFDLFELLASVKKKDSSRRNVFIRKIRDKGIRQIVQFGNTTRKINGYDCMRNFDAYEYAIFVLKYANFFLRLNPDKN